MFIQNTKFFSLETGTTKAVITIHTKVTIQTVARPPAKNTSKLPESRKRAQAIQAVFGLFPGVRTIHAITQLNSRPDIFGVFAFRQVKTVFAVAAFSQIISSTVLTSYKMRANMDAPPDGFAEFLPCFGNFGAPPLESRHFVFVIHLTQLIILKAKFFVDQIRAQKTILAGFATKRKMDIRAVFAVLNIFTRITVPGIKRFVA